MIHRSVLFTEEPPQSQPSPSDSIPRRKRKRKHRASATSTSVSSETNGHDHHYELNTRTHYTVVCEDKPKPEQSKATVGDDGFGDSAVDDGYVKEVSSVGVATSETVESLELKADDSISKKSPVTYFLEKVHHGNPVWRTTTIGNEKGRERVYDTIFRLSWRCELLIDVGFFVCFNSFLSLLTVMPTRIVMTIWRLLKTRKFKRPSAIELLDFGYFLIMACGVTVLQQIDISLIYHMIRGQATIKLYVIYNVIEIFDKLCQSFIRDVLQMLFHSAEGLARCPPETESTIFWIWRFISDQVLAVVTSIVHSFILLVQAITLSACIVSHYNALPALLVLNNFC